MKVYDQLGDTLARELHHSRFNIALELFEVVGLERANVHLGILIRSGDKKHASAPLTAPVLPSGRMYDLTAPVLPATGGVVGIYC